MLFVTKNNSDSFGCENSGIGILPRNYRGTISKTRFGVECMNWEDTYYSATQLIKIGIDPESRGVGDHNYCRDARPSVDKGAWCFKAEVGKDEEIWDYCTCGEGTVTTTKPTTAIPTTTEQTTRPTRGTRPTRNTRPTGTTEGTSPATTTTPSTTPSTTKATPPTTTGTTTRRTRPTRGTRPTTEAPTTLTTSSSTTHSTRPSTKQPTTTATKEENGCPEKRVEQITNQGSCIDLNNSKNREKYFMKNLNKNTEKDSAASVQCIAGYQLNLPNKIKTAATCTCDSNNDCKWVFNKGDVMCVKERKIQNFKIQKFKIQQFFEEKLRTFMICFCIFLKIVPNSKSNEIAEKEQ